MNDDIRCEVGDWYRTTATATDVADLIEISRATGVAPRPHQGVAWLAIPRTISSAPASWLKDKLLHQSVKQVQVSRARLDVVINRLQTRRLKSPSTQMQFNQTTKQLWETQGIFTAFQTWCTYRDIR